MPQAGPSLGLTCFQFLGHACLSCTGGVASPDLPQAVRVMACLSRHQVWNCSGACVWQ